MCVCVCGTLAQLSRPHNPDAAGSRPKPGRGRASHSALPPVRWRHRGLTLRHDCMWARDCTPAAARATGTRAGPCCPARLAALRITRPVRGRRVAARRA
eukprot:7385332-Prymnesium_polylepis.2